MMLLWFLVAVEGKHHLPAMLHMKKNMTLAFPRPMTDVLKQQTKSAIIVARSPEAPLFESLGAVVSGYAIAMLTGRPLIVDAERLGRVVDLSHYKAPASFEKDVERCRQLGASGNLVVDDFSATDLYAKAHKLRRVACVRPLPHAITWVATCHERFVGEFSEDVRAAFAQVESLALKPRSDAKCDVGVIAPDPTSMLQVLDEVHGKKNILAVTSDERELTSSSVLQHLPTTTDDDALKANYALSRCPAVYGGNATDWFVALATARAALRYGWPSETNRSAIFLRKCPAWPKDPVDAELLRSVKAEREVFGRIRLLNGTTDLTPPNFLEDGPGDVSSLAQLYLRAVLWRRKETILIYKGRIYADRHLLENDKARKHISLLASIGKHYPLPNIAYIIHLGSTGQGHGGYFGVPTNYNATTWSKFWRHGRRLILDQDEDEGDWTFRVPSLSIAKMEGYDQPSVMIPNMYFGTHSDIEEWQKETDIFRILAEQRKFETDREPRVLWRGAIRNNRDEDCGEDVGNYARLAAVSLSHAAPEIFDVKCVDEAKKDTLCHMLKLRKPNISLPCFNEMPYDEKMQAVLQDPDDMIGSFVHRQDFSKYQYLLNLPGSLRGSYSRNLNHLWLLDAVILLWNATGVNDKVVEWYYPALRDGVTHIAINQTTALRKLRDLRKDTETLATLRFNSKKIHDRYLAPAALARYFLRTFQMLRSSFDLGGVMDHPRLFERELDAAIDCDKLSVLEFVDTPPKDHHRRQLVTRFRGVRRTCADILSPKPIPENPNDMEIVDS